MTAADASAHYFSTLGFASQSPFAQSTLSLSPRELYPRRTRKAQAASRNSARMASSIWSTASE